MTKEKELNLNQWITENKRRLNANRHMVIVEDLEQILPEYIKQREVAAIEKAIDLINPDSGFVHAASIVDTLRDYAKALKGEE